jgi:hypothetical protein
VGVAEQKKASVGSKADKGVRGEIRFGNPLEKERTLLSWKAVARPHKKRSRDFFTTIGAIVFLLSIILAFFQEFFLIGVVWAVAFFSYVLAKTEPERVEHQLTTRGVKMGENKYWWNELARFWFEEKWGEKILMIDMFRTFPGRLMMLLGSVPEEQIRKIMERRVMHDKPEDTFVDKATKWLQEKVPLEEDTSPRTASVKK